MQTRRRHPTESASNTTNIFETNPLLGEQQANSGSSSSSATNPLFVGGAAPLNSGSGSGESSILIGDNNSYIATQEEEDKYHKSAARPWNLRSISNRLQATSGQAIRNFIQQPLSAAAAVVTGNHSYAELPSINSNLVYTTLSEYSYQEENVTLDTFFDKDSIVVMASRDRTGEFSNAIRSLQSRNISRAVNIRDPRKAKQVQSYSEFMMVAKYVGKNIASTYAKLEKLTLCKYR